MNNIAKNVLNASKKEVECKALTRAMLGVL